MSTFFNLSAQSAHKLLRAQLDFRLSQLLKYQETKSLKSERSMTDGELQLLHQCHQETTGLMSCKNKSVAINNGSTGKELQQHQQVMGTQTVPFGISFLAAIVYVLSGVSQPLLVTLAKDAGLADQKCQLYMFFYYLGPASVTFSYVFPTNKFTTTTTQQQSNSNIRPSSLYALLKPGVLAVIDLFAQSMNYGGSTMAGPTIFAIIYSSVTIWTAVFSRMILSRIMNPWQWVGCFIVFGGLVVTAFSAMSLGPNVFFGSVLVMVGSMIHASVYVLNEVIMTKGEDQLSVRGNCAVQGLVAAGIFGIWQLAYTRQHFLELIQQPMEDANTSYVQAGIILLSLTLSNLIHALTYMSTLKHFPGGATSAGVMKGLQAVLVFVVTSWFFCGKSLQGGREMCFSNVKLLSLVIVVGGVITYGKATEKQQAQQTRIANSNTSFNKNGYQKISSGVETV